MNTEPLQWITDPGHGWLAVDLEAYPDAYNYGTGYGYEDAKHIYLEEDVEAYAFMLDHPEVLERSSTGQLPEKSYDFDAPVRRLPSNMAMLDTEAHAARVRAEREASA